MRTLIAALLVAACVPSCGGSDRQLMLDTLGISLTRPGANGMDRNAPNAANYDEAKVGHVALPDPLRRKDGTVVTFASDWWRKRRPEIVAAFDHDVYGRVPEPTPAVRWDIGDALKRHGVITQQRIGHVDNRAHPSVRVDIRMDVTLPSAASKPVPLIIVLTWPGNRTTGPDWREQIIALGWGYAELVPTSIQADNGAGLRQGIIGLVNKGKPRKPDDWGALRAWAWGVSRAVDHLQTDRRIDAKRIGVAGHSRYGKAALVAMAYDPRIAIGYISSSGAGGAKLLRRDFGQRLENLAAESEYHWMAGNFLRYAGPRTVQDLPVDAHQLIALCAPRPVFIGAGDKGDEWVDPRGMFLAAVAAGPVYRLLGAKDLGTTTFPPLGTALISGDLAFRQHPSGHTPEPNWATFLAFAQRQFQAH